MPLAEGSGDGENVGGLGAGGERAQVGRLYRRPVSHGIGEGHSQFYDVRAAIDQRVEIGRGVPITRSQEADQGRVRLGESGGQAAVGTGSHSPSSPRPG